MKTVPSALKNQILWGFIFPMWFLLPFTPSVPGLPCMGIYLSPIPTHLASFPSTDVPWVCLAPDHLCPFYSLQCSLFSTFNCEKSVLLVFRLFTGCERMFCALVSHLHKFQISYQYKVGISNFNWIIFHSSKIFKVNSAASYKQNHLVV